MRNVLIILVCSLCLLSCKKKEETKAEDSFSIAVAEVLKAFHGKDAVAINRLIHKDRGLVVIYNPGAFTVYTKTDKVDFDNPVPEYLPYDVGFPTDYELVYEVLPEFSCETDNWDKYGLYCDTLVPDNRLSSSIVLLKEYGFEPETDWDSQIAEAKKREKDSRRVILSADEATDFVFHLALIDGKWYLTLLDRFEHCSA